MINYALRTNHFRGDTVALSNVTNPTALRKATLDWLEKDREDRMIPYYLESSYSFSSSSILSETQEITTAVKTIFSKIEDDIHNQRYAVTNFVPGQFDRKIPVLTRIPENGRHDFILSKSVRISQAIGSREEADYIAKTLSEMDVPWNSTEGCDARAEMGCRLLKAMSVPENNIDKIWIRGNFFVNAPSGDRATWQWHVAPLITTSSGDQFVVDPFFNKTRTLMLDEWIQSLTEKNPLSPYKVSIIQGNLTKDMETDRSVLVTDAVFKQFTKRLACYSYISATPEGSFSNKRLNLMLPARPDLRKEPSFFKIKPENPKPVPKKSECCTVS